MEYTIRLTERDLPILSAALVELPYRVAAPLIDKLNRQIASQGADSAAERTERRDAVNVKQA